MRYEVWFMDKNNNIVGEEKCEADDLIHVLSLISSRQIIFPEDAVTLSMEVVDDE